jgi:hypothetical protein
MADINYFRCGIVRGDSDRIVVDESITVTLPAVLFVVPAVSEFLYIFRVKGEITTPERLLRTGWSLQTGRPADESFAALNPFA